MMTLREALVAAKDTLQKAGVPDPQTDASLLLSHVTGLPRLSLPLNGQQSLLPQQERQLSTLLLLRSSRQPLQYVLGTQGFWGLDFEVDPRVLIPRPETEILCEVGLSFLRSLPHPHVLDLCTGSGAIAVTIAHECPGAKVTATDLSGDALQMARRNGEKNGVAVQFLQGDLFSPVAEETFDCILSNPPYVESASCQDLQKEVLQEPLLALDGGPDGLAFYRSIVREAPTHLRPGALLAMEIGCDQGDAVCDLLRKEGCYQDISLQRDLAGLPRVVSGRMASGPT